MNKRELIEHINNTLFDNLKDTLFQEPTFSITENAKDNKVAITFETEQGCALVGGMLKKSLKKISLIITVERSLLNGTDLMQVLSTSL